MNRFFISDWRTHKSFIIRQLILFTLFMAFIPGCASKGGKVLSEQTLQTRALEPSPGNALVYFYYEKLSLKSTKVELDGALSEIEKDTYVLWEVSPGKYQLTFTFGSGILSEVVASQITCEAEQIYYFRMAGTDRETHNIQQIDPQKGQSKIEEFKVIGWFKDGAPVIAQTQISETPRTETTGEETRAPESAAEEQPVDIRGHYHTLVIGIEGYQYFDPVPTAVNDARAVAQLLQEEYGFQVQILLDQEATREGILSTLSAFRKSLTADDKLLVYYAGRGVYDEEAQTAYWLPVNAGRDEETDWIFADIVTANLRRIPATQILIVADSVYAEALTRARHADLSDTTKRSRYLEKSLDTRSRILMLSGTTEPVASSEKQNHSIFAHAFLDALTNIDREVFTAEELFFEYIREAAAGSSEYLPELKAIRNSGHQGGDFIFKQKQTD